MSTAIGEIENKLVMRGHKVKVQYLHSGNSTDEQRTVNTLRKPIVSPYVAIAKIYNDKHEFIGQGVSYCSPHDNPNRLIGRHRAVVRACKDANLL